MPGINSYFTPGRAKKANFLCLLLCICAVLFVPLKKEIWYDETISVLISKGISRDTPSEFAGKTVINSEELRGLNSPGRVYVATLADNGNSFLYNLCLHWFTGERRNNLFFYMLFSKLCAVAMLIALFALCKLFFERSIFISVALVFLLSDKIFWGMAHEVRAYEMGMLFVTLAAIYCYKFMYREAKPTQLFFTGLYSVCAVLCHYLSAYAVLVFIGCLIVNKKWALFSLKNIAAMVVPVILIGIYFYFAMVGFEKMNRQNETISEISVIEGFNNVTAFVRSLKFTALNFKCVFPAFRDIPAIASVSGLLVFALYYFSLRIAPGKTEKRDLNILFALGISGTVFLLALSLKSHHYSALYSRYYSFCVPFATLFVAYALKLIFEKDGISGIVKYGIMSFLLLPCLIIFALGIVKDKPTLAYNHVTIANIIIDKNITRVEVPAWNEAFLVNGFVPASRNVEYVLNTSSNDFILHSQGGEERVPLLRVDK